MPLHSSIVYRIIATVAALAGVGASAQPRAITAAVDVPQFSDVVSQAELRLPVTIADRSRLLELRRTEVFARTARLVSVTDAGEREMAAPRVATFSGRIADEPGSTAFISISLDAVYGFVDGADGMHILSTGPASERLPAMLANLVALPLDGDPFHCGVDASMIIDAPAPPGPQPRDTPPCRTALLAVETDAEFTSARFGGNAEAAAAYVATLVGSVSAIYTRDLNVRIQVSYLRLWETPSDPWTGADMNAQLGEFQAYWNANMTGVQRNLAHYMSGRGLGGGLAWVGVMCHPTYGYALSSLNGYFPHPIVMNHGANWDLMVTAHELGHNFGAPHTHDMTPQVDNCANGDCSVAPNGTIMSYCHFCPNGLGDVRMEFHPRSINETMLPHLNAACSLTGAPFDGTALWFDGANDYASIPAFGDALPRNEVTVEFWIYPDDTATRSAFGLNPDSAINRFQAHVPWSDGRVYWDLGNINLGGRLAYTPPVSLAGRWHHFAFVASQAGNYMRIYRNGVLEAQKTGMRAFIGGNFEFRLGALGAGTFFRGRLDEFRIWNVARTDSQIAENFDHVINAPQPGLLYAWNFEEAGGSTATDAASGRVLTLNGPSWSATDDCLGDLGQCLFFDGTCLVTTRAACGHFGGSFQGEGLTCDGGPYPRPGACCLPSSDGLCALLFENDCIAAGGLFAGEDTTCAGVGPIEGAALEFDGVNDRVRLGNPASMNFAGPITIEAWIRPDSTSGTRNILVHGVTSVPPRETGLRLNGDAYQIYSFDGSTRGASAPVDATDVGRWIHLAGTYDGAAWRLYRNGVLAAESASAVGALTTNAEWGLGSRPTTSDRVFDGQIDDVRLWNVARSGAEIAANLGHALTGGEAGLVGYWRLDEGTGTVAGDSTANGNNGTLVNGPAWHALSGCPVGGCTGDLDGDGAVSLADLSALLAHFGDGAAAAEEGDLDGDGDVDLSDLATMLANFGREC